MLLTHYVRGGVDLLLRVVVWLFGAEAPSANASLYRPRAAVYSGGVDARARRGRASNSNGVFVARNAAAVGGALPAREVLSPPASSRARMTTDQCDGARARCRPTCGACVRVCVCVTAALAASTPAGASSRRCCRRTSTTCFGDLPGGVELEARAVVCRRRARCCRQHPAHRARALPRARGRARTCARRICAWRSGSPRS